MKTHFLAGALCLALTAPAAAQDTETLARTYVALPGVQAMMDNMFSAEALVTQFMSQIPPSVEVSEAKQAQIGELMAEAMNEMRPELERAMVESSSATFDAPELEALIAFYETEAGASVMAKMQPMMADFLARMGPRLTEMQQTLVPEVVSILQAEE
ncbi:DUF2059 domain-containing protein [Jannaschia seohaensis]|uniref:DUF2059 domain-containing protein n=1 Tax=Jannaschia seohaensis TaxID=475081 RepID=A0A2Y9AKD5_9RHOB|nr:DUF2059 domain-containing protein [Jannaschia seohaensis]PWJ20529.1 hypothetical protein BCF38_103348 [Jannaschia seohaensis]SSA44625.1 hypothetical protein SAMN05421539_103348 [Jannaschia seohaensis]